MDPDPLRLLETAHPLRSPALLPSSPNSRFRLRPNSGLTHPPETVNKRVNKIKKNVDGPTQMSRRRGRRRLLPRRQSEDDDDHEHDQETPASYRPRCRGRRRLI